MYADTVWRDTLAVCRAAKDQRALAIEYDGQWKVYLRGQWWDGSLRSLGMPKLKARYILDNAEVFKARTKGTEYGS